MSERHTEDGLQRIREIAYDLWEKEGCPEGRDQEFWLRAEAMEEAGSAQPHPGSESMPASRVDEESAHSFPASDPPSFTPSKTGGTTDKAA